MIKGISQVRDFIATVVVNETAPRGLRGAVQEKLISCSKARFKASRPFN